jgi:amino acid transporter
MQEATTAPARPAPRLGLWDVVSMIVGIVVGTGIYKTPPEVLANVSGPGMALAVWALCGLLSLVGALCYAELAATYPSSGGDYFYLNRAFGHWLGFLFAWTQLTIVRAGNIGMMAFVFADYAVNLGISGHLEARWPWAVGAIVVLAGLNLLGVVCGKGTQNLLTAAKVFGLTGIVVAGLGWPAPAGSLSQPAAEESPRLALALVLVIFTYGGWNDAAFVAAEVRGGPRNVVRALVLGTVGITLIYLLVNLAYLWGLGWEGARGSQAIAADVLARPLGDWGARAMSLLVMVSALGSINGMIFSGARMYAALGADHPLFAWLGRWHVRSGTPWAAILVQSAFSVGLVLLIGSPLGQGAVNALLVAAGQSAISWRGIEGFDVLLACTTPVFWLFLLLTSLSLFVLRRRDGGLARPFSVPFYPGLPMLFCVICGYLLYSSLEYGRAKGVLLGQGLLTGAVVAAGLLLYWLSDRRRASPGKQTP